MNPNDIHIGELIEQRIAEIGITKAEFGRRISTSRQNVNTILKKKSLDSDVLRRVSKVLKCDFFKYYLLDELKEKETEKKEDTGKKMYVIVQIDPEKEDEVKGLLQ